MGVIIGSLARKGCPWPGSMTVTKSAVHPESEDTFLMPVSYTLDHVAVTFDDTQAGPDAGLILPVMLSQHLDPDPLFR